MGNSIDELLKRNYVKIRQGAPQSDIDAVAEHYESPIPKSITDFWLASGGTDLARANAELLGPSEVLWILDNFDPGFNRALLACGFLPLLDDHESNYLVVALREPLAQRVVY